MEIPTNPSAMIDLLRVWFFAKDRSIVMANDTFIEGDEIDTPGNPVAGRRKLYAKDDCWHDLDSDGVETSLCIGRWELISETELTGSVASVTFSSIPTDFRSLAFITQVRSDRASTFDVTTWRANGDSGNNYDYVYLQRHAGGGGTSGGATAASSAWLCGSEGATSRASNFGIGISYFPGYKETDREKMSINEGVTFGDLVLANMIFQLYGGHWRNTAAINSITLLPLIGNNFVSGSIFALYGIL